jgi:hypothetical protein
MPTRRKRERSKEKSKAMPFPLPKSNDELEERLEAQISEKTRLFNNARNRGAAAILPLAGVIGGALAFFNDKHLSELEVNSIYLMVGIMGPMFFAGPIVLFKNDYLRALLRKSPDWIIESIWGPYTMICGLAFLIFLLLMIRSGLLDILTIVDAWFVLLVSAQMFGSALRAYVKKKSREDTQSFKKEMGVILDSKWKRLAYSGAIAIVMFVLPAIALTIEPHSITTWQGSLILVCFAPIFVWLYFSVHLHQLYFIQTDELEQVAENVKNEGAKTFDKNVLAFANILRYGQAKKHRPRHSQRHQSRIKKSQS